MEENQDVLKGIFDAISIAVNNIIYEHSILYTVCLALCLVSFILFLFFKKNSDAANFFSAFTLSILLSLFIGFFNVTKDPSDTTHLNILIFGLTGVFAWLAYHIQHYISEGGRQLNLSYKSNCGPYFVTFVNIYGIIALSVLFGWHLSGSVDNKDITSVAAFALSTGLSLITLYTLWHQEEMSSKQGRDIPSFMDFIKEITDAIEELRKNLQDKKRRYAPGILDRGIFIFTNNPALGSITAWPEDELADASEASIVLDFYNALHAYLTDISGKIQAGLTAGKADDYFYILYANEESLKKYHQKFFENDIENNLKMLKDRLNTFFKRIQPSLDTEYFQIKRLDYLPKTQYIIVGSRVFQFQLEPTRKHRAEVSDFRVIEDRRLVSSFHADFESLKEYGKD